MRFKDKKELLKVVDKRISVLLYTAFTISKSKSERIRLLSTYYNHLAFSLSKRHRLKLRERKWLFCRKCLTTWNDETTTLEDNWIRCLACGYKRKVPKNKTIDFEEIYNVLL